MTTIAITFIALTVLTWFISPTLGILTALFLALTFILIFTAKDSRATQNSPYLQNQKPVNFIALSYGFPNISHHINTDIDNLTYSKSERDEEIKYFIYKRFSQYTEAKTHLTKKEFKKWKKIVSNWDE